MKTTLVLGTKGFIGQAVLERLKEKNVPAYGLNTSRVTLPLDQDAKWLSHVLQERKIDVVYLCAGSTGGVGKMATDPLSFVLPNVRIHMNVFEACARAGVRRVVSSQSITGYPNVAIPVAESEYYDGELHPAYFVPGNTWRFVGRMAEMFKTLELVFVRPSNVYGPRNDFDPQTSHVIEATVRKVYERQDPFVIWGNGQEKRDPTYIDDLAEAMSLCGDCPPGAYNIGSGQSVDVNQMVKILCDYADYHPELHYDTTKPSAIQTRYLDITKARSVLGFEPRVSIEEGLQRTYDWYAAEARLKESA